MEKELLKNKCFSITQNQKYFEFNIKEIGLFRGIMKDLIMKINLI